MASAFEGCISVMRNAFHGFDSRLTASQKHTHMLQALKKTMNNIEDKVTAFVTPDPLMRQEGGEHYKCMRIQPVEFVHANNIPYREGCAIKYLCRHKAKGGVVDLLKAKHYIDLIISLEYKNQQP